MWQHTNNIQDDTHELPEALKSPTITNTPSACVFKCVLMAAWSSFLASLALASAGTYSRLNKNDSKMTALHFLSSQKGQHLIIKSSRSAEQGLFWAPF